jgi:mannose/cellobiose epimerase-like protein (N-acyl-D-glucosamine 2-epimerase family)
VTPGAVPATHRRLALIAAASTLCETPHNKDVVRHGPNAEWRRTSKWVWGVTDVKDRGAWKASLDVYNMATPPTPQEAKR